MSRKVIAAAGLVLAATSTVAADIDVELRTVVSPVNVTDGVDVELYLVANPAQSFAALDLVMEWDTQFLHFDSFTPEGVFSRAGFPPGLYGLNENAADADPPTDGDGYFIYWLMIGMNETVDGDRRLATFHFTALLPTAGEPNDETIIDIKVSGGTPQIFTNVFDGIVPGLTVTGNLVDAAVEILADNGPPCGFVLCDGSQDFDEDEADCGDPADITNGGCFSATQGGPFFTDINCGETVCGTTAAPAINGSFHPDEDWYRVTVAEPTRFTWTLTPEFNAVASVAIYASGFEGSGNCADITTTAGTNVGACQTGNAPFASECRPAGTYFFIVQPTAPELPCGDFEYRATLVCTPCDLCPGDGDCCDPGGNGSPGCNNEACCDLVCAIDPGCCTVEWDDLCAATAIEQCNVCQDCPIVLDFETEDDFTTPLLNGQDISTPPEFGVLVAISGDGDDDDDDDDEGLLHDDDNEGPAIFDSTPGVNAADEDLWVSLGNVLILQEEDSSQDKQDGFFDEPNDAGDGGVLMFDFVGPVEMESIDLIDVDSDDVTVKLYDVFGNTRTYDVPEGWTRDIAQDGPPGFQTLDLTTLADQPGFQATATASEEAGFDPTMVVSMKVILESSGAVDNVTFCPTDPGPCGDPKAGSCCEANGTPGCDTCACCVTVCRLDPSCCDVGWDSTCVQLAEANCEYLCVDPPVGACCLPDGSCDDTLTEMQCEAADGEFAGAGVECDESGVQLIVWGVCDVGSNDSRLFVLNLYTGEVNEPGGLYENADIEGATWFNGGVKGGKGMNGHTPKLADLDFSTGDIGPFTTMDIDDLDPTEVTGMATDDNGVHWAFFDDRGFAIVEADGDVDLKISTSLEIEGVAVSPDGGTLWGLTEDAELYRANTTPPYNLTEIADFDYQIHDEDVENLELLSDNLLAFFAHNGNDVEFWTIDVSGSPVLSLEKVLCDPDLEDIEAIVFPDLDACPADEVDCLGGPGTEEAAMPLVIDLITILVCYDQPADPPVCNAVDLDGSGTIDILDLLQWINLSAEATMPE